MSRCLQWFRASLVLTMLAAGCAGAGVEHAGQATEGRSDVPAETPAGPAEIDHLDAAGAQAYLAAHPEALLLDVRNPPEWDGELGHIDGAVLIPLPELDARLGEIEAYRDKPVVAICRSGNRSRRAQELLRQAGFENVINLEGGMLGWREAGL